MKIDMFWIWFAVVMAAILFQSFFTVKKSTWDVSYTYTTDATASPTYGQIALKSVGDSLSFVEVQQYLKKDIEADRADGKTVGVVVLSVQRRNTDRFWQPFWRKLTS
jgi:hypothetical protein